MEDGSRPGISERIKRVFRDFKQANIIYECHAPAKRYAPVPLQNVNKATSQWILIALSTT